MAGPYFICELCNSRVIAWKVPINSKELPPAHVATYVPIATDGVIVTFNKLAFPLVLNGEEVICAWCGATAQTIGDTWYAREYQVPNSIYTVRFIISPGEYYSVAFFKTGSYESGYATKWCKGAVDLTGLPMRMCETLLVMTLPDDDETTAKVLEAAKIALGVNS